MQEMCVYMQMCELRVSEFQAVDRACSRAGTREFKFKATSIKESARTECV
jgi:hypothetical protein